MPMSEYMRELREKVGHQLLEVPAVSILVFDARDRVLLVKHENGGVWVTPGGAVEPRERPADAAVREAFEETGLHVSLRRISGVYGGPEFDVTYTNGDVTSYLMIVFEGEVITGKARPDGIETLAVGHFGLEEIAGLDSPAWVAAIVADALARRTGAHFAAPTWRPVHA